MRAAYWPSGVDTAIGAESVVYFIRAGSIQLHAEGSRVYCIHGFYVEQHVLTVKIGTEAQ